MAFLMKGKEEYWGIGLVDMICKVCAAVLNCRIKRSVTLHDVLPGFRAGRGTGTETLETKLVQQLAGITHKTLFQVFLDVRKAYAYLDRCW